MTPRQTINLTVDGNALTPSSTDAGVQGENEATVLTCTVPADWDGLDVRLTVIAQNGAYDISELPVTGVITLPLRAGVMVPGPLTVSLRGSDGAGVRKTADCRSLRVQWSAEGAKQVSDDPQAFEAILAKAETAVERAGQAEQSAADAQQSKTSAAESAGQAAGSAEAAAQSAQTAGNSATQAGQSAGSAAASASSAAADRATVQTLAGQVSADKIAVEQSAQAAVQSATTAQSAASAADTAKQSAQTAATQAADFGAAASGSASAAAVSAASAGNSETSAASSASEAGESAAAAASSAAQAADSAAQADGILSSAERILTQHLLLTQVDWLTGRGSPVYETGKFGNAESGGVLYTPSATIPSPADTTGRQTVEFWFKISTSETISQINKVMFSFGDDFWIGYEIHGNLTFNWRSQIVVSKTILDGNWHHLAFVWGISSSIPTLYGLYVDGQSVTTPGYNPSALSNWPPYFTATVGGFYNNYTVYDSAADIDELRISNIARYTAEFTPTASPFGTDRHTLLLAHMEDSSLSLLSADTYGYDARPDVPNGCVEYVGGVRPTDWLPYDRWVKTNG